MKKNPLSCSVSFHKAEGLMHFLIRHGGNVLKWNERGQFIYMGEIIEGSHITDLIRDAVSVKSIYKPLGYEQFY